MRPDLGGAGRDIQELGDFLMLEVLETMQHEDLTLIQRQTRESGLHEI